MNKMLCHLLLGLDQEQEDDSQVFNLYNVLLLPQARC